MAPAPVFGSERGGTDGVPSVSLNPEVRCPGPAGSKPPASVLVLVGEKRGPDGTLADGEVGDAEGPGSYPVKLPGWWCLGPACSSPLASEDGKEDGRACSVPYLSVDRAGKTLAPDHCQPPAPAPVLGCEEVSEKKIA